MRLKRSTGTKQVAAIMLSLLLAAALSACGSGNSSNNEGNTNQKTEETNKQTAEKLSVVTSIYPIYFMANEIGGEHVNAVNLIPTGIDPHDWTPKSKELKAASDAALFLFHGAELEGWVDGFLKGLSKDSKVITKVMSEGIDLIAGEHEDESEEEHDHHEHAEEGHDRHEHGEETEQDNHEHAEEGGHEDHSGHHHEIDPHTWVSPKSALIIAQNVKNSLVEADPEQADYYEQNYTALHNKLLHLDKQYEEKLAQVPQKNIVVSHQAFGYLARDYGLKQVAIMGLNPEAEPLAQDILNIAKFVKEHNVKYIFFEELVSDQLAKMLASEAKVDTMVLNPLEGLTNEQQKSGENYLTLMERNLQNLVQALQ